ncbi:acyltransferase, partial [Undibacterium sp. 5I2]
NLVGGVAFVSNFVLWKDAGYFDILSDTKPLLHLWSLAIEEQFYIFWPFILWIASRKKINLFYICIAVGILSFTLNIVEIGRDPTGTFYSPLTRFWELLVGSALAIIYLSKRSKNKIIGIDADSVLSCIGACLILCGLVLTTKENAFPGYWALFPTIGAALLIYSSSETWFNQKVLSNKFLVWFGLISFPLYLWHWPILSFLRVILGAVPSLEMRIAAVVASIILAWATLHVVEKPIRFSQWGKTATFALVLMMISLGSLSGYSYVKERNLAVLSHGNGLNRTFTRLNPLSLSGADNGDLGFSVND